MKLKKIRVSCLDHWQALQFYGEVINSFQGTDLIVFEDVFTRFKAAVVHLSTSFFIYHRSVLVKQISLEQRNLQHNLMSVRYRLKKNLESKDAGIVMLSEKAVIILDYFYQSKHISVSQKDDNIFNVIDALEDYMTEKERSDIGISTYVKSLKKINNQMRDLMEKRDEISITETRQSLIPDRHFADNCYRELITWLNLQFRKNPENIFFYDIMQSLDQLITSQSVLIDTQEATKKVNSRPRQNAEVA